MRQEMKRCPLKTAGGSGRAGLPGVLFLLDRTLSGAAAVGAVCALLARSTGEEMTVLDGAAPDVEQLITAAGTISLFWDKAGGLPARTGPRRLQRKGSGDLCRHGGRRRERGAGLWQRL